MTLDGTGSFSSGGGVNYYWSAPGIVFDDSHSATPTATFPLGATTVTLTVTYGEGSDSDTIDVVAQDTTPPDIQLPASYAVECVDPGGTPVDFSGAVIVSDLVDVAPAVSYAPLSPGDIFPPGVTGVTVTAEDFSGNESEMSFAVIVGDTTAPVITPIPDVTVEANYPDGYMGDFTYVASDDCDPSPTVTDDAPDLFPLGITTVIVTASDASGNQSTDSFDVTVQDTTAPDVEAGPDQTVMGASASAQVTLHGVASDICDTELDVVWENEGAPLADTLMAEVTLPCGVHTLTLMVTDDSECVGSDTVTIQVDQPDPVAHLNIVQDTFEISPHLSGKAKDKDKDTSLGALTAYLELPDGVTDDPEILTWELSGEGVTTPVVGSVAYVHGQVVELEFPVDTAFIQELLGIPVSKLKIKENSIDVTTTEEPPETIDLNSLTVQAVLADGSVLRSQDAAREINVRIHAAPASGVCILAQNYPNPFNPETWIPFALPEAMDVVIHIHDTTGRVVRRLDLGIQPAGYYISRHRAAYWDGTNDTGEYVSSGIYFYTIQADDFTSTRKMVVAR